MTLERHTVANGIRPGHGGKQHDIVEPKDDIRDSALLRNGDQFFGLLARSASSFEERLHTGKCGRRLASLQFGCFRQIDDRLTIGEKHANSVRVGRGEVIRKRH
jgi:hypothetical protein